MRVRGFLNLVPEAVKAWAAVIVISAVLIGLGTGYMSGELRNVALYGGAALVGGLLTALWLLCLGFVYADARRRGMRPVLWVLVAALFPHLLGFLLYFVMRQPIAAICMNCRQTIARDQRFCSSCGYPQVVTTPGGVRSWAR